MDTCKYLGEKLNLNPSFEAEISKMDHTIIASIESAKGRKTSSKRLNKKSSDPKEEFPDRDGGIGNKKDGCQLISDFVRREAEHVPVLKEDSKEGKLKFGKQDPKVAQIKISSTEAVLKDQKSKVCLEGRAGVELKRSVSLGARKNRGKNIGTKRELQQRTEIRHLQKGSGRRQKTGVGSSISSAPERPLHKAKSTSQKEADRGTEMNKKVKRLFSPEPEEGNEADVVKGYQMQQTTKSRNQNVDSGRLKYTKAQPSISFAPKKLQQTTNNRHQNKDCGRLQYTKAQPSISFAPKKLQQTTKNRHQNKDCGRLQYTKAQPSISFAPKKFMHESSSCKTYKVFYESSETKNPDHDARKGLLGPEPEKNHKDNGLEFQKYAKKVKEGSRLQDVTDESSIFIEPEKPMHEAKSNVLNEKSESKERETDDGLIERLRRLYGTQTGEKGFEFQQGTNARLIELKKLYGAQPKKTYKEERCEIQQDPDAGLIERLTRLYGTQPEKKGREFERGTDVGLIERLKRLYGTQSEKIYKEKTHDKQKMKDTKEVKGSSRLQGVTDGSVAPEEPIQEIKSEKMEISSRLQKIIGPNPKKEVNQKIKNDDLEVRGNKQRDGIDKMDDIWMCESLRRKRHLIEQELDDEPPRKVPRIDMPAKK